MSSQLLSSKVVSSLPENQAREGFSELARSIPMNLRHILTILAVLVVIAVNGLAETLPLNGQSTKQISDSFPVLFTPAGYVFSIWGLIYLGLVGFAIYQALPAHRSDPRLAQISPWFLASCVFNCAWIFLWHYNLYPLTLLAMLGLLVSLIGIYQRLEIGLRRVSPQENALVSLPFSVYLGWISVATIANFSIVLYDLKWNALGVSPVIWTFIVLSVAVLLGAAMIRLRREIAYPLVLIWAFVGIAVQQAATPLVVAFALLAALAVAALLVYSRLARITNSTAFR
ncbi:MAG TPA: tryptophan-rich sensory protein [Anaerolineales bacterium]